MRDKPFGFYFLLHLVFLTAITFEALGVRRRW